MKALARIVLWWTKPDIEIEEEVRYCKECQLAGSKLPTSLLNTLPWSAKLWSCRFCGFIVTCSYIIGINAGSKWIEAFLMLTSTPKSSIQCLRASLDYQIIWSVTMAPHLLVHIFNKFLTSNGIKHWKSSPYHPSSNGLAEKAIQIVKQGLKQMTDGSINDGLSQVLFT